MTVPRKLPPPELESPIADFALDCAHYLQRAEEQRVLARQMMKRAQDIIKRARADAESAVFRRNLI